MCLVAHNYTLSSVKRMHVSKMSRNDNEPVRYKIF